MTEVSVSELVLAVERQHGGKAIFREAVTVDERHKGQPVWQGVVHVFDLENHPEATRAYAWSAPVEGSDGRRFYTVLGKPPINSAQDAVRAAIVAEHRRNEK